MSKKTAIITIVAVVFIAASMGYVRNASAQGNMHKGMFVHMPGVFGEVTEIDRNIITITNKKGESFSVDASIAKIMRDNNTNITLADVKIGDPLMVMGAVSGTTVSASTIFDGPARFLSVKNRELRAVSGRVTSVSGTNVTVTGKNGTNYIVDVSNAEIVKVSGKTRAATSVLDLAVGDTVMVRGAVTDTTVVAKKVVDGKISEKPFRHMHGFSGNFGKK